MKSHFEKFEFSVAGKADSLKFNKLETLPLVDILDYPYILWSKRNPSYEEREKIIEETNCSIAESGAQIRDRVIATIEDPSSAAFISASASGSSELESAINKALSMSNNYRVWKECMLEKCPRHLSKYQKTYPYYDQEKVENEIRKYGYFLSFGQVLFHAGCWESYEMFTTERPLSATISPHVAINNANHKGKAYKKGRIDILALKAKSHRIKAFLYNHISGELANEKELLIKSGVNLRISSESLVREDYPVSCVKEGHSQVFKEIPIYVLEVDVTENL